MAMKLRLLKKLVNQKRNQLIMSLTCKAIKDLRNCQKKLSMALLFSKRSFLHLNYYERNLELPPTERGPHTGVNISINKIFPYLQNTLRNPNYPQSRSTVYTTYKVMWRYC